MAAFAQGPEAIVVLVALVVAVVVAVAVPAPSELVLRVLRPVRDALLRAELVPEPQQLVDVLDRFERGHVPSRERLVHPLTPQGHLRGTWRARRPPPALATVRPFRVPALGNEGRPAPADSSWALFELAGVLNGLGSEVTILHQGRSIMKAFDSLMRETLLAEMSSEGVSFNATSPIRKVVQQSDGKLSIEFTEGNPAITDVDSLIWATGRKPNLANLGLENTSIKVLDNGFIDVDQY